MISHCRWPFPTGMACLSLAKGKPWGKCIASQLLGCTQYTFIWEKVSECIGTTSQINMYRITMNKLHLLEQ